MGYYEIKCLMIGGTISGNLGVMSHASSWSYWLRVIIISSVLWRICHGACTFPADIRGKWTRSRDSRSLTFNDTQVTGMSVKWNTQTMDPFLCYSTSGNRYVIYANYTGLIETTSYYVCWELVKVTSSAYLIYDLSDIVTGTGFESGRNGVVLSGDTMVDMAQVCSKSVTTEFFSTLVKSGSTIADVAVACPSVLNATFSYGLCAPTTLDFCPYGKTGVLDYKLCPTQVFRSASGQVTCMGHVTRSTDIYLNMFDSGNVVCWKVPDKGSNAFSVVYFNGDCTTVSSGSSTSITLTQMSNCDLTTTTTTTTTTSTTTTSTSTKSTAATVSRADVVTTTMTSSSSSNDSAAVGVGVGVSLGVIALVALGLLAFIVIRKNQLKAKVADLTNKQQTTAEKKNQESKGDKPDNRDSNPVTNGTATITHPKTSLPPIGGNVPVGEPLRT